MTEYRNRNNEMYLSDWYDNYLMKYKMIIEKPRFTMHQHKKYTEKLLEWYENWNGYMEEVSVRQYMELCRKADKVLFA